MPWAFANEAGGLMTRSQWDALTVEQQWKLIVDGKTDLEIRKLLEMPCCTDRIQ